MSPGVPEMEGMYPTGEKCLCVCGRCFGCEWRGGGR